MKSLPEGYRLLRAIDLGRELRLLILLNVIGLILFGVFGALFFGLMLAARPDFGGEITIGNGIWGSLWFVLQLLATYAGVLSLHEVVHGIFFYIFTRARPKFGLRSAYAYAAAPEWFIPRNQYLIIGLAPLVVITVIGVALLPVWPPSALLLWWLALTANASGAVGDMAVVGWLKFQTPNALINDFGDRLCVYVPD